MAPCAPGNARLVQDSFTPCPGTWSKLLTFSHQMASSVGTELIGPVGHSGPSALNSVVLGDDHWVEVSEGWSMPSGRLEVVSKEGCLALLRQATMGRVAVTVGAIPEIFPVNFCLIDDAIVFRTGPGTKLYAASRRAIVAFEVDEFDVDDRHGWSVLVVGPSEEVTQPDEITKARRQLADGWVPGDRDHVLRIAPHRVSGRRISGYR
jgi:uncharacterized protein